MTFIWTKTGSHRHECKTDSDEWVIDLDKPTDRYVVWKNSQPYKQADLTEEQSSKFLSNEENRRSIHSDGRLLFYHIKDVKPFCAGDDVSISPRASTGTRSSTPREQREPSSGRSVAFQEKWTVMKPFRDLCLRIKRSELLSDIDWTVASYIDGHRHYLTTLAGTITVQLVLIVSGKRWPKGTYVVEMHALEQGLRDWEVVLWSNNGEKIQQQIKQIFNLDVDDSWFNPTPQETVSQS